MASKKWLPDPTRHAGLLFDGAPDLLRLLDELTRRPFPYWRDKTLPIVYLIQLVDASPLNGIEDRLAKTSGRKVPFARIHGSGGEPVAGDPLPSTRHLLDSAVIGLASRVRGGGRRLRFPHYSLATWLLGLYDRHNEQPEQSDQADQIDDRIADDLQEFIKNRQPIVGPNNEDSIILTQIPWALRLLIGHAPKVILKATQSRWAVARWFARHPTIRRHRGEFIVLARMFARNKEPLTPENLQLLLTDAFLEDLRRSYRRSRILGLGRRRTS